MTFSANLAISGEKIRIGDQKITQEAFIVKKMPIWRFLAKNRQFGDFLAKSHQIGKIQVGTTLMYIFTLIHVQKSLKILFFIFL